MKVNARDVAAGTLLLVLALVGLWLNQAHGLGTARRMGPGYLPMLVFWIQAGLGAAVLGLGLFNGPDRLEAWPWREQMVLVAAICTFGLLLEQGGLVLAITATVVVSAFADPQHRPLGVLGMTAFLLVVCWWIFVRQLEIRVPVWPQYFVAT